LGQIKCVSMLLNTPYNGVYLHGEGEMLPVTLPLCSSKPPFSGGFITENDIQLVTRSLSPQESRVLLALTEQGRLEATRAGIVELFGSRPKAADLSIESLRHKGWLQRPSWGEYLPEQGPDALGDSKLLALASRIANPYYIGFGTAEAH